jgi:hypothetical protein
MSKENTNSTLTLLVAIVGMLFIVLLWFAIDSGPIAKATSQPTSILFLTHLVLPFTTSCVFLLFTRFLFIDENFKRMRSDIKYRFIKKIVSEHVGGFKYISADFVWDYTKPLKMLRIRLSEDDLPKTLINEVSDKKILNLGKFPEVQIVLDQSVKTSNARRIALNNDDYRKESIDRLSKCLRFFKSKEELENIKIVDMNQIQYPCGIMIQNGEHVFYAPLWNKCYTQAGAVTGPYLKIPANSETGQLMIQSFDALYAEGEKVVDYASRTVDEQITNYINKLKDRK